MLSIIVIIVENGINEWVQIQDKTVYISFNANAFSKALINLFSFLTIGK